MRRTLHWTWVAAACLGLAMAVQASANQVENASATGAAAATAASVPRLVRFSSALKDPADRPHPGIIEITFSLYREEAGGEPLWFETQTVEVDAQGRYSVLLGAMHPDGLPMDLFASGEARWLGVSVGKLPEQPRVLLVAVPYALKAADADTLGGKPATAFVATDQLKDQVKNEVKTQVTQSATTTRTLVGTAPAPQALGEGQSSFSCNLSADCVAVTQTGSGIGLHATAGANLAIFGETASTTGRGVYGLASAATGGTIGVWGGSYSTSGVGVSGRVPATTGATKGMYGVSLSTSGIGVHGDAPAASGSTRGVWGSAASPNGIAVWGQAYAASGTTYGVLGTVASPAGIGVSGQANAASGSTIGVLAKVLSSAGTALVADNNAGGKIISGQSNGVEKFRVDATGGGHFLGNVGIGTAVPAQKLDVAGNLRIKGLGNALIFPDGTVQTTAGSGGGGGTITGVTAGAGLSGGGTAGSVSLSLASASCSAGQAAVGLPLSCQPFATLGANTFTGTQAVTGNVTASGSVTAASFIGNGSALTTLTGANVTGPVASATAAATATTAATANGLTCAGCVSSGEVDFNYAGSSSKGGAATSALTASDALALGGVAATEYARLGPSPNPGDQTITGNLTVTGTVNGVTITQSTAKACTIGGSPLTCLSANILAGYTGTSGGGGSSPTSGALGGKSPSLILPGGNTIADGVVGGTISGGGGSTDTNNYANTVTSHWGTVAGGGLNQAGDNNPPGSGSAFQSVGGGLKNTASGLTATVAGGFYNLASGNYATVGGGELNNASGVLATVAGGLSNTASGQYATVAGGGSNTASGYAATVAGGGSNIASGYYSFAAGCHAQAATYGSFVWSGRTNVSGCVTLTSSAEGQFLAFAPGGVTFYSGTLASGVSLAPGAGSWSSVSDRNLKANFAPVDGWTLLAKLSTIPMQSWNYQAQSPAIRHIGPMAQDFYAAFSVGEDEKHIATVDADGVALAAIQALYKLSREKDERIGQLTREVDDLRARLARIEKAVTSDK